MSVCRWCGQEIEYIFCESENKYVSIDPEPVFVIEGSGTDRFIDDLGDPLCGRVARPEEESRDLPIGFFRHWDTCGYRRNDRRGGRGVTT